MSTELEAMLNNRYVSGVFINHPEEPSDIHVVFHETLQSVKPIMSVIMPIFNQEEIIERNLRSILEMTTDTPYEFILVIDRCSDDTESAVLRWATTVHSSEYPLVTRILIVRSNLPLFETTADNVGFLCAQGQYCLEIQADMEMVQKGYNMKLLEPFVKIPNVIAVSGRCCHSFDITQGIGKLGDLVEKPLSELPHVDPGAFYIDQTCNRGPLLLHTEKLRELGYLDERNFFQDYCDHDLFCRALLQKGWICGYRPIEFDAPLKDGSNRKPKDPLNQEYYQLKKEKTQGGRNGFFWKVSPSHPPGPITMAKL